MNMPIRFFWLGLLGTVMVRPEWFPHYDLRWHQANAAFFGFILCVTFIELVERRKK